MGYYTRILSPAAEVVSVKKLHAILKADALKASLKIEDGTADDWTGLILAHESGPEIAAIERNPVAPGELGQDEIDEFLDEIAECKPASAAKWLAEWNSYRLYSRWAMGVCRFAVETIGQSLGSRFLRPIVLRQKWLIRRLENTWRLHWCDPFCSKRNRRMTNG